MPRRKGRDVAAESSEDLGIPPQSSTYVPWIWHHSTFIDLASPNADRRRVNLLEWP